MTKSNYSLTLKIIHATVLNLMLMWSASVSAQSENTEQEQPKYDFSDFRTSPDQHGIGFGLLSMGGTGAFFFYDYNDHPKSKQYHLQINSASDSRETLLGKTVATLSKVDFVGSYRHVFPKGWYLGVGGGWYTTTLKIEQPVDGVRPAQKLEFYHRGHLLGVEGGWQGNDFYYFHIGLRFFGTNKTSEYYKPDLVYDIANHREETKTLWDQGKSYSGIFFGFGWYLHPDSSSSDHSRSDKPPRQPSKSETQGAPSNSDIIKKAKRCQEKGGIWVNDSCQITLE
jgi:hypothetical protein